jgi:hypothetical protein
MGPGLWPQEVMSTGSFVSGISGWLSKIEYEVKIKRPKARQRVDILLISFIICPLKKEMLVSSRSILIKSSDSVNLPIFYTGFIHQARVLVLCRGLIYQAHLFALFHLL